MARVVAVHGINNEYLSAPSMAAKWVPSLLGGIANAGSSAALTADDVSCVFYGDKFRRPGRFLGADDLMMLGPQDVLDGAETALVADWWRAAAEVDSFVVAPGTRTLGVTDGLQAGLAALSGSRFLAGAAERVLIHWLQQVRAYFVNTELRAEIQQRFVDEVAPDTRVVVAHSLGSVVAYEALCEHPQWSVTTLVTLGSPLAIPNVILDRLTPPPLPGPDGPCGVWPGRVLRWTNIADRLDFVALVKRLHLVFGGDVVDIEITNGASVHDVSPYLTAAETGRAILSGLGLRIDGGDA